MKKILIFLILLGIGLSQTPYPTPGPIGGSGSGGSGTVTSIATTSPITGGTITGTGTIACATCVVASSPGVGIAHFAGSTQTATSSLIVAADITSGTITGTQIASSIALAGSPTTTTQSAADNSTKIATTAYSDAVLKAQYRTLSCQPGLGDGLNAITAGTYLESTCWNKTGATYTITAIQCFTDNAGSSTLNVTNGTGTGLLTGAVTCSSTIASGTQSGTTTIANNDFVKFTFVADGTSKQTTWVLAGTY